MRYISISGCHECPYAHSEPLGIKVDDTAVCDKIASHPVILTYIQQKTLPDWCPLPLKEMSYREFKESCKRFLESAES